MGLGVMFQKVFVLLPITWATEDGLPPPDTPVCGFMDELCPPDATGKH